MQTSSSPAVEPDGPESRFACGFFESILHPARATAAFDRHVARGGHPIPWGLWSLYFAVAVCGSLIFGAGIAVAVPGWSLVRGGLWLTLSAGLSWIVFGPALWLATRQRLLTVAHACMVAMVWGEIVLMLGSLANLALRRPEAAVGAVAASNVVMAAVLAIQLRALGVPVWKTLVLWVLVLDGAGALFFMLFYNLLLR